jgi:hypothetical protein
MAGASLGRENVRGYARPGCAITLLLLLAASGTVSEGVELQPKVGFAFEHFGETYRLTADRDTVSTISDFGPLVGLSLRTPYDPARRFQLDADFHLGRETRRLRFDFSGRLRRAAHAFEVDHQSSYRVFRESGDYTVSSDTFEDYARLTYELRLDEAVRLRLHETLDVVWYREPSEYNLNTLLHRPGGDARLTFGEFNEARIGYRFGRRTVPDSTSLEYRRHTGEFDLNLLHGWSSSLDVSYRLDRRVYPPASVRESSWENRVDVAAALSPGERSTLRLVHENELMRYEEPDELDFDYHWVRTGLGLEIHQTEALDISVMPLYTFLTSGTAPEEEYAEIAIEFGTHWRLGCGTWITVSDEVGRRNYESPVVASEDALYSDYVYNRVTLLVAAELAGSILVDIFANWEPENHSLDEHDSDSRLLSVEIEYRL